MSEIAAPPPYPVRLAVDYPEQQSRWKALLRLPLSIPVLVFSWLLQSGVALANWAAILVSGRIPRWLFEFQVAVNRWQVRAGSYLLLLTDEYPPFEGDYPVRYDVQYPERLARWRLVVWKLITSVPHLLVLAVLTLTLVVVAVISWVAILFGGRFPRGLHGYLAGVLRWQARVQAYLLSLTDEFPPFSLSPDAGAGGTNSYIFSSVAGVLAVGALVGFSIALLVLRPGTVVNEVSYERLLAGELQPGETRVQVDSAEDQFESTATTGSVEIIGADDPADALVPFLVPQPASRFVRFELALENEDYEELDIGGSDFRLKRADGHDQGAVLVIVDGRIPPLDVDQGETASAIILFELPEGVDAAELRFNMGHHVHRSVVYEFR